MIAMDERLLTVDEVAGRLQMKPQGVRRLLRLEAIPSYKIAREWRVKESDLQAFIESRKYKPEERK